MLRSLLRFCSIEEVLHHIDNAIQYGEDADVRIGDFEAPEGDDDMPIDTKG